MIDRRDNGLIKVITGVRRCGKTYLVEILFRDWLIENGVDPKNIIFISLETGLNAHLRNPLTLSEHIHDAIGGSDSRKYVIIDEIQLCASVDNPYLPPESRTIENMMTFYDVVLGLREKCDIYVTGSNSKMLSKDVLSSFRGRTDEIPIIPLSFSEFHSALRGDVRSDWMECLYHGGMPGTLLYHDAPSKNRYLSSLFNEIYLKDSQERDGIHGIDDLSAIVDVLASSSGGLVNPQKIADSFRDRSVSRNTVANYIEHLEDSFLISGSMRFDIRGRRHINGLKKVLFHGRGADERQTQFQGDVACKAHRNRGA